MTPAPHFESFGLHHLAALVLVAAGAAMVRPLAAYLLRTGRVRIVAWALAGLIVAHQLVEFMVFVVAEGQPWVRFLPLQLCDMGALLADSPYKLRKFP